MTTQTPTKPTTKFVPQPPSDDDEFRQQALEREKRQKEQAENPDQSNDGKKKVYEEIQYAGFDRSPTICVRVIGSIVEKRKLPTDPKIVMPSEIVAISKKKGVPYSARVNWKWKLGESDKPVLDKEWIFHRFISEITKGEWIDDPTGAINTKTNEVKRIKKYEHDMSTETMKWITWNSRFNFPKSPWPREPKIVLNCIPRGPEGEWARENRHAVILSDDKTLAKDKKKSFVNLPGISHLLYDQLFLAVGGFYEGGWKDIDLIVTQTIHRDATGKKSATTYEVKEAMEDLKKMQSDRKNYVVAGPLTDEEREYTLYDLDKLFSPTSSYSILNVFGDKIKLAQKELNLTDNFYEELVNAKEIENKEYKERHKEDLPEPQEEAPAAVDEDEEIPF